MVLLFSFCLGGSSRFGVCCSYLIISSRLIFVSLPPTLSPLYFYHSRIPFTICVCVRYDTTIYNDGG